jgi:hypothetical protein
LKHRSIRSITYSAMILIGNCLQKEQLFSMIYLLEFYSFISILCSTHE